MAKLSRIEMRKAEAAETLANAIVALAAKLEAMSQEQVRQAKLLEGLVKKMDK